MPSELETALLAFRRAVLEHDAQARQRLLRAFADAMTRLRPLIELAEVEIALLEDVTSFRVFQLDRWREIERQLQTEIARIARWEEIAVTESQRALVAMAGEHAQALATIQGQQARIAVGWARVPRWAVEDLIGATINGAPLQRLFDEIGPGVADLARQTITDAMALGQHPRIVANALAEATGQSFTRTYTISRTEMLRAYRSASIREYQRNADILDGWVWIAAKGRRTCAACLSLDGQVFPLSERFMRQHVSCRCSSAPQVSGVDWQRENGETWLVGQSVKVQDGILGKSGGQAYRAGEVQLHDFVKQDVSPIWGRSYRDGGIAWARRRAMRRAA